MRAYRFGGFGRRVVAYIIDLMILGFLCFILLLAGAFAAYLGPPSQTETWWTPESVTGFTGMFIILYQLAAILLNMTYFIYFHSTTGQTPGKRLLGLQVVSLSGQRINPGTAFLRWVGYILSAIVFNLGFLWIAFDPRRQGWHDKIAGTMVIRTELDIEVLPPEDQEVSGEKCLDKRGDI